MLRVAASPQQIRVLLLLCALVFVLASTIHVLSWRTQNLPQPANLQVNRAYLYFDYKINPIYLGFNLNMSWTPRHVDILIIISSAKEHFQRRDAIRATWLTQCRSSRTITVKCIFMTETSPEVEREMQQNPDILVQPLRGGVEFGRRYLYHIAWAVASYDFHYLLRVDDDYFLCLDRLLHEIPMSPPLKNFHWGYTHCLEDLVRPEESLVMFSSDLIYRFLSQNPNEMLCHPWADQQISLWLMTLHIDGILTTDTRLHHDPPVQEVWDALPTGNICNKYIGLHGVYPKQMKKLWDRRGSTDLRYFSELDQFRSLCHLETNFDWALLVQEWRYEPRLCSSDPQWDTTLQASGTYYGGREKVLLERDLDGNRSGAVNEVRDQENDAASAAPQDPRQAVEAMRDLTRGRSGDTISHRMLIRLFNASS